MSLDCWADCWSDRVNGAKPLNEVGHSIGDENFTMDRIHVFHLDNGEYAVVTESGCSCYESNDASLDLHPTLIKAFDEYMEYKKVRGLPFTNLEYLEFKLQEKENESHIKNFNPKTSPELED